jgi:phosphoglycerate dehydrogenase-like enzyme
MAKNIPEHSLQTRQRSWKALPSMNIRGSRLGIVGLGSIGKEVARLGKAMDMEVWGIKRELTDVDFVDRVFPPTGLPSLLCEADYVVLSLPLTEETRHLIGEAELGMMKPSSCLINVSRGAVVDEDALYQALKKSRIRGACMDVFRNERPLPRNSRFYGLPNLLVTSYSAYDSAESPRQLMDRFFENLRRFNEGRPFVPESDQLSEALQGLGAEREQTHGKG